MCVRTSFFDKQSRPVYLQRRRYTTKRAVTTKVLQDALGAATARLSFSEWRNRTREDVVSAIMNEITTRCHEQVEYVKICESPNARHEISNLSALSDLAARVTGEMVHVKDELEAAVTASRRLQKERREAECRLIAADDKCAMRVGDREVRVVRQVRRGSVGVKATGQIVGEVMQNIQEYSSLDGFLEALVSRVNSEKEKTKKDTMVVRLKDVRKEAAQ
jgi:hypothetical protein